MRRKSLFWLMSIIISLIAITAFISYLDYESLKKSFQKIDYFWLLISSLLILFSTLASSLRLDVLLTSKFEVSRWTTFKLTINYGAYIVLLPARLGDVLYGWVLNRKLDIDLGSVFGIIVTQRIFDLFVVGVFLLFSTVLMVIDQMFIFDYVVFIALFLGFSVALFINMDGIISRILFLFKGQYFRSSKYGRPILRTGFQFRSWISNLKSPKAIFSIMFLTFIEWVFNFISIALVPLSLGIDIGIPEILFVATFVNLIGAIPLPTIAGIGVVEVGLTGLYLLVGMDLVDAGPLAILTRIVLLGSPLLHYLISVPFQLNCHKNATTK